MVGRLAGVAAANVTVASAGTVDFFALRDELVVWGNAAVNGLRDRATGVGRFDRTQRLVAAHSVLVVTAFYEALGEVLDGEPDLNLKAVKLSRAEQVALATGEWRGLGYGDLVGALIDRPPPIPTAYQPFEATLGELTRFYRSVTDRLAHFIQGLDAFEARASRATDALQRVVVRLIDRAVMRYVEAYRALAAQVPEFAIWSSTTDAQATRIAVGALGQSIRADAARHADVLHELITGQVDRLRVELAALQLGLQGVGWQLAGMAVGAAADARCVELATRYRHQLDRPILDSTDVPAYVALPSLGGGYVNPSGRMSLVEPSDKPATESWWSDKLLLDDLQGFFIGHLTSRWAVAAPLVVLGQPGSGKSVLTRVLAARLPETDFLAVRVELRTVPADAPIQTQIEEALFLTLGERVSWPDLSRSARSHGALPVVMLDGFDELLQATGINRADYLERVREFQEREAELDRPVAVVVTTRTVVANRARFPDGCVAVRLEPFAERHVRTWLDVWNDANRSSLQQQSLHPLTAEVALRHSELASQPLLLLLLALYDSKANALQHAGDGLGRVELYERLFADFVGRQVDKHGSDLMPDARRRAVEAEWRRLSAVALAMFNRGGDVITEAELDADLPHLLAPDDLARPGSETRDRALTAGQLLVGRFFFIHESRASRDTGTPEKSFEFLHATFGDFLAARLIVTALVDLADERIHRMHRRQPGVLDAGFFYAATSFVSVTRRAPLREFCEGMIAALPAVQRQRCHELVVELLPESGYAHPTWTLAGYEPQRHTVSARHAAFSANLVWLAMMLSDGPVDISDVMGEPADDRWRSYALLWYSQLGFEDHKGLVQTMRATWRRAAAGEALELSRKDRPPVSMVPSKLDPELLGPPHGRR
jgi:hypothetical protein